MASYVKDKLMGSSSSEDTSSVDKEKYMLAVSASTSYDDDNSSASKQVTINGPPTEVSRTCKVAVRIREYQGIPIGSPETSPYFEDSAHSKDTYSIAVSWIPDEDVSADDVAWGIELINPIRERIPKRFIDTAFNIVKSFIDPSLRCDPYADRPWLNGPILCSTAITFGIGEKNSCTVPPVLEEGGFGDGTSIRSDQGIPPAEDKRRKYFSDETKRKEFVFEKGRCYAFDFHNGYIDWKNYALKLPGFSLGVLKYVNDRTHTVRFVLKNRSTGQLYVATTFRLLFGDELKRAMDGDEKAQGAGEGGAVAAGGRNEKKERRSGDEQVESHRTQNQTNDSNFSERGNSEAGLNGNKEQSEPNVPAQFTKKENDAATNYTVSQDNTKAYDGPRRQERDVESESPHEYTTEPPHENTTEPPRENNNSEADTNQPEEAKIDVTYENYMEDEEKKDQKSSATDGSGHGHQPSIEESLLATASKDGRKQSSLPFMSK